MPNITDQDHKTLMGAYKLLDGLLRSPKTKAATEAAIKTLNPNVQTTNDLAAGIVAPYAQRLENIEKHLAAQVAGAIDADLNREYQTLRQQGWTDEGIETLKKFQIERKIPNPMDAAAAYERRNPPPPQEPSLYSPTDWGIGSPTSDEDMNLLFKDEDQWANREIGRVLHDFRRSGGDDY